MNNSVPDNDTDNVTGSLLPSSTAPCPYNLQSRILCCCFLPPRQRIDLWHFMASFRVLIFSQALSFSSFSCQRWMSPISIYPSIHLPSYYNLFITCCRNVFIVASATGEERRRSRYSHPIPVQWYRLICLTGDVQIHIYRRSIEDIIYSLDKWGKRTPTTTPAKQRNLEGVDEALLPLFVSVKLRVSLLTSLAFHGSGKLLVEGTTGII